MITRCGALELGRRGIRVVGIAPGLVETPLTKKELENPAMRELFMDVIPMKRAVAAEEVAAATVFLASDNVRSINGETIAIDGGSLTRGLSGTTDRAEESMIGSVDEVLSGSDRPVSPSGTSPRGGPLAGEPHR